MITEMIGSPISGRSTTRSSARPRRVAKRKVRRSAGKTGTLTSEVEARKTYAPSRRNSPCAKLRIPLDL